MAHLGSQSYVAIWMANSSEQVNLSALLSLMQGAANDSSEPFSDAQI